LKKKQKNNSSCREKEQQTNAKSHTVPIEIKNIEKGNMRERITNILIKVHFERKNSLTKSEMSIKKLAAPGPRRREGTGRK
jgi:hypothetical protein